MLESAFASAARKGTISVAAYVDKDDPLLADYQTLAGVVPNMALSLGARTPVPGALNILARRSRAEILFVGSDDLLFRTADWDEKVREAISKLTHGLGIVVPLDGAEERKGRRVTHWFSTQAMFATIGYLANETYEHFFVDTHIGDIARRAGCLTWLDDVLIEHMHPNHKKAMKDATHHAKRRGAGEGMSARDEERYHGLALERDALAERLTQLQLQAI